MKSRSKNNRSFYLHQDDSEYFHYSLPLLTHLHIPLKFNPEELRIHVTKVLKIGCIRNDFLEVGLDIVYMFRIDSILKELKNNGALIIYK